MRPPRWMLLLMLLPFLVSCDQFGASEDGLSDEAARERDTCQAVREDRPDLTAGFVADWAPRLLDETFQRAIITTGPLPANLDPALYGDLTDTEELGLTSCLAERLAEQRTGPPVITVEDCDSPECRNVYADSFVTATGTPLTGGLLRELIFVRDPARLRDPADLPPTISPLPPLPMFSLPTVPPLPASLG